MCGRLLQVCLVGVCGLMILVMFWVYLDCCLLLRLEFVLCCYFGCDELIVVCFMLVI